MPRISVEVELWGGRLSYYLLITLWILAQSCQWCSCHPMKQAWGRNDCLLYPQAVQKVKSLALDCVVSHHLFTWKLSKKCFVLFFFKCWESSSPDQALSSLGNSPLLFLIGTKWQVSPARSPAVTENPVLPHHVWPQKLEAGETGAHRSSTQSPAHPEGDPGGSLHPSPWPGLGSRKCTTNHFHGVLSLTDLSFSTQLLSAQPTRLIPVLYFSQFSLLHPQFCWLLSTQERQNSWGNSRAVENFSKCFEPTQPEESIQRKTGKAE